MNKIYNILLIASMAVGAASCDEIAEDERLIPVDIDSFEFTNKAVLLEEFTGHLCVNCPDGAEVVHSIESWAGGNVIPVSIHCGSFAATNSVFPEDFTTEAGNAYYEAFSPDAFPSCMMDRTMGSDGVEIYANYETWTSNFIYCAAQTALVDIDLDVAMDGRQLDIDVAVNALYDVDQNVSLQLWLIEDGITGVQLSSSGIISDYQHNHVLRDAINGTWGEEIGTISAQTSVERSYSYTIADEWVPENCSVVAFVYETASRANVLQAAQWK